MRIRILLTSFKVPMVWAAVLLMKYFFPHLLPFSRMNQGMVVGLFMGSATTGMLFSKKYLTGIIPEEGQLSIVYFNTWGARKLQVIPLSDIVGITRTKKTFLQLKPDTICLWTTADAVTFYLYNAGAKATAARLAALFPDK